MGERAQANLSGSSPPPPHSALLPQLVIDIKRLDSSNHFQLKGKNFGSECRLSGSVVVFESKKRLFLHLGDRVVHLHYEHWGLGAVVEEMTSVVPGGTCLIRILFEDGQQRTFNNDLDNEQCCYFFGVRRQQHPLFETRPRRSPRSAKRE